MKNKLFKIFACFLTLTFVATPTSATLITDSDTVIVGDKEWAQVDLFYGLSWLEINDVCPFGNCGSGILNGYDMNGWTWATASQVGDLLFAIISGHPGGLANYSSGLRVIDISDIDNENMTASKYFDTFPSNNNANYDGSWNVYPFFESQNIVISGTNGFTLVKESSLLETSDFDSGNFNLYPNPAKNNLTINSNKEPLTQIEIFNVLGQKVLNYNVSSTLSENINISSLNSGMYLVKINNLTTKRLIVK